MALLRSIVPDFARFNSHSESGVNEISNRGTYLHTVLSCCDSDIWVSIGQTDLHRLSLFSFQRSTSMSDPIFSQTCVCGRMFTDLGGFTRHEKGCRKGKKRLSTALNNAKKAHQAKRARLSLSRRPTAGSDKETISSGGRDDGEGNEQATQQAWYHQMFPSLSLTPSRSGRLFLTSAPGQRVAHQH